MFQGIFKSTSYALCTFYEMELEETDYTLIFYRIFALILIAILISPTHTFAETFIQAEKIIRSL